MTAAVALGIAWTALVLLLGTTGWRPPRRFVGDGNATAVTLGSEPSALVAAASPASAPARRSFGLATERATLATKGFTRGLRKGTSSGPATVRVSPGEAGRSSSVRWLGSTLRRLAGRPADPAGDHRVGWAVVAAAGLAWVVPALSLLPLLWAAVTPALAARRAARAYEAAVVDRLPDVVDLLALTTSAGLSVSAAVRVVGDRPGGPLGAALAAAATHVDRGGTTAEALTLVTRIAGPPVRPLADALAEHTRYGTPLGPSLDRVAIEARLRRRRHAEEAARRLPVTLLFPLILTTLPAFVLLTIVPLLAGSFSSLSP